MGIILFKSKAITQLSHFAHRGWYKTPQSLLSTPVLTPKSNIHILKEWHMHLVEPKGVVYYDQLKPVDYCIIIISSITICNEIDTNQYTQYKS